MDLSVRYWSFQATLLDLIPSSRHDWDDKRFKRILIQVQSDQEVTEGGSQQARHLLVKDAVDDLVDREYVIQCLDALIIPHKAYHGAQFY